MKRTVFVTGAGGFIGSHVASDYVNSGDHVVGIGHKSVCSNDTRSWAHEETPVDLSALERLVTRYGVPDVLAHCAGGASVSFSIEYPLEDFKKNINTLMEVLEFSRRHDSSIKILYLSSAAVYGNLEGRMPIKETSFSNPMSPYGLHKRLSEEFCSFYSRYWHVPVAVVRLFSVYGDGLRKQLLWDACNKLSMGRYVFGGIGKEERDWLHIRDVVKLLRMAESHASTDCPVVNGGSGIGYSVEDILTRMGKLWDIDSVPSFSGISREGDPPYLVADITRISEWGFAPSVGLTEGLLSYIEWYKRECAL